MEKSDEFDEWMLNRQNFFPTKILHLKIFSVVNLTAIILSRYVEKWNFEVLSPYFDKKDPT